MKLFFDTSAIVKAFHTEEGSDLVVELLNHQISINQLNIAISEYNSFFNIINLTKINSLTLIEAEKVFDKNYKHGLRTLDAIQFSSFLLISDNNKVFISADEKLCNVVKLNGYNFINPMKN